MEPQMIEQRVISIKRLFFSHFCSLSSNASICEYGDVSVPQVSIKLIFVWLHQDTCIRIYIQYCCMKLEKIIIIIINADCVCTQLCFFILVVLFFFISHLPELDIPLEASVVWFFEFCRFSSTSYTCTYPFSWHFT